MAQLRARSDLLRSTPGWGSCVVLAIPNLPCLSADSAEGLDTMSFPRLGGHRT